MSILRRRLVFAPPQQAVLVVLLAVIVLLFPSVVFKGESFYERDVQFDAFASFESFVRCFREGAWPLWDRAIAFGQPLLAYPNSEVLYPPTWLNLLFRPAVEYPNIVLAHLFFCAIGTYRLGRRLGLSRAAATLTGGVFVASGPLLSLVNVYHIAGACWLPWVWWAADRAIERRSVRSVVLLGVTVAAQVLAGSPEMCALGQATIVLAVLRRGRGGAGRAVGVWAMGTGLGLGLSAAQWVPSLAVAAGFARTALSSAAQTIWSVTPLGLLQLVLPLRFQDLPLTEGYRVLLAPDAVPFLAALYLGLSAVPLVTGALRRGGYAFVLAAVFVAAIVVALGSHTPAFDLLAAALPLMRLFRYPSKLMVLTALVWAVLAGLGLDTAAPRVRTALSQLATVTVIAIAIVAAALALAPSLIAPLLIAPLAEVWRVRLGVAALALIAVLLLLGRIEHATQRAVLVACVLVDLVVAGSGLNRTTVVSLLETPPPWLGALRPPDHQRVFSFEYWMMSRHQVQALLDRDDAYTLTMPLGVLVESAQVLSLGLYPYPPSPGRWGLEPSYEPDERGLYRKEIAAVVNRAYAAVGTPAFVRLLQMAAVARVASLHTRGLEGLSLVRELPTLFPERLKVYAVPDPLPRTYVVHRTRALDDEPALDGIANGGIDFRNEIVLPPGETAVQGPLASEQSRIVSLRSDRVELDAELDHDGFVVLVDGYDPGWRVSVDGRPAHLLRANVAFRAVAVPAGRHRVEMTYRPWSVTLGAALSVAFLVSLLALLLIRSIV